MVFDLPREEDKRNKALTLRVATFFGLTFALRL